MYCNIAKHNGGIYEKAVGINLNGELVGKIPYAPGGVLGAGEVGVFFYDSCEIAWFHVAAGIGKTLEEWPSYAKTRITKVTDD